MKGLFIFVAGALVGAGGMYLGMKKYFEAKSEAKINEELSKIDKSRNKQEELEKKEEPVVHKETSKPQEGPNLDIYKGVIEKKNYDTIAKSEKAKTMTDVIDEKIEAAEKKTTKKVKAPKKITQDEFDATDPTKKDFLTFYADEVLADGDDVAYDPTEIIGAANLKSFKSTYDTMYVMNYATGMAYEITYSNGNFKDFSGGAYDE